MKFIATGLLFFCFSIFCNEALDIKGAEYLPSGEEIAGRGRGVAVSKRHVLTAAHVLTGHDNVTFRTPYVQVGKNWIAGIVLGYNFEFDLALIELPEGTALKPVDVLAQPRLEVHGNLGLNPSTRRALKLTKMEMEFEDFKVNSAYDLGGYSGSPVMAEGQLIGILTAGRVGKGTEILVIGLDPIHNLIKQHLKKE